MPIKLYRITLLCSIVMLAACSSFGATNNAALLELSASPDNSMDLFALSGWIFGAVGLLLAVFFGAIQVKSYVDQKRFEKSYQILLENARTEWQGKYTEEQVKNLDKQFTQLQTQIEKNVPVQARRVFLQDRLNLLQHSIAEAYDEYMRICSELGADMQTDLDDSIRTSIEREIFPSYIKQREQQRLLYWMVVLILLFTILPLLLPIGGIIIQHVIAGAIAVVLSLHWYPKWLQRKWTLYIMSIVCCLTWIAIISISIYIDANYNAVTRQLRNIAFTVFLIGSPLLFAGFIYSLWTIVSRRYAYPNK